MYDLHVYQIRVSDGLRSFGRQWEYWGKGRTKDKSGRWKVTDSAKIVTYAVPGQSYHQYGMAIDTCFMGNDPYLSTIPIGECEKLWNEYGRLCIVHGLQWGGNFKKPDRPHCQVTYGLSIHAVQIIYEDKGIKGVFERCRAFLACGTETGDM